MNREPIYAALFAQIAKLQTAGTIATCSRRLLHWDDCTSDMQPAIFMAQVGEGATTQIKGAPYKWEMDVKLYIYVRVNDDGVPGMIINPIIDAIEALISPNAAGQLTLGGLVNECFIDGRIETFEGTLGAQEVAVVPIKMLVR